MQHGATDYVFGLLNKSSNPQAQTLPAQTNASAVLDAVKEDEEKPVLDEAGKKPDAEPEKKDDDSKPTFDDVSMSEDFAATEVRVRAANTVQQWLETDDLDEGETLADRLLMLLVGIADANQDGELDDDETAVLNVALEATWDYLSSKGVSDEDCSLLLNDWDADAATRIVDVVASSLPDGDDAADADIDAFAFGDDAQEATFDAVYKKTMAIRHGKKVRINKRISGTVRLTAKQKIGIRKAQLKSHSAKAVMRRMKSRRIGKQMGM